MNFEEEKLLWNYPPEDDFPRDFENISRTNDILYVVKKYKEKSTKGLKNRLKKFWDIRYYFHPDSPVTIKINDVLIRKDKVYVNKYNFKWKVGEEEEILNSFHKLKFFDFDYVCNAITCPLDGQIAPVTLDVLNSDECWQNMCGRHWRYLVCPDCLGIIYDMGCIALN